MIFAIFCEYKTILKEKLYLKMYLSQGTQVALLVKRRTLNFGSGNARSVVGSSPKSGFCARSVWSLLIPLPLLCSPTLAHALSIYT